MSSTRASSISTPCPVNALTGTTDHWEAEIAPALRDAGLGTLTYNFRGQVESTFSESIELTKELIVEDILKSALANDIEIA